MNWTAAGRLTHYFGIMTLKKRRFNARRNSYGMICGAIWPVSWCTKDLNRALFELWITEAVDVASKQWKNVGIIKMKAGNLSSRINQVPWFTVTSSTLLQNLDSSTRSEPIRAWGSFGGFNWRELQELLKRLMHAKFKIQFCINHIFSFNFCIQSQEQKNIWVLSFSSTCVVHILVILYLHLTMILHTIGIISLFCKISEMRYYVNWRSKGHFEMKCRIFDKHRLEEWEDTNYDAR